MFWWIGAILVWLVSAACIIGTIYEVVMGKKKPTEGENIGAYFFHGATALLALWLFFKALA